MRKIKKKRSKDHNICIYVRLTIKIYKWTAIQRQSLSEIIDLALYDY
jgi:hypothetical protein